MSERYFIGKPCKHGHTERYTSCGACVPCARERAAGRYVKRPPRVRRYSRAEISRRRYAKDPKRAYEFQKRSVAKKPALYRAKVRERQAAQLQRTPPWANREKIREIYEIATAATELFGEAFHVDHEIPLRGKLVSGLHVHTNLRVLRGVENSRKSNRFEVAA
jgi:hypothetical protein